MKTIALIILTVGLITSCISETKREDKSSQLIESISQTSLMFDHIALININKTYLKKAGRIHANLTDQNCNLIDSLLQIKINEYNSKQKIEFELSKKENPNLKSKIDDYIIDLTQYVRQYVVFKNEKGEKEVWINCMCGEPMNDEWKKGVIIFSDGGNCFFQLTINLTLRKVTEFSVNGNA